MRTSFILQMLVPQTRDAFGGAILPTRQFACDLTAFVHLRVANKASQNLLPLFLRPLRLFVAPDNLRACRIALLKATHWPLVALILLYESGRRAVDRRREAEQPLTASKAAVTRSSLMRRPLSSRSVPTRLMIRMSDNPPNEQARTAQGSQSAQRAGNPGSQDRIETLQTLAASLRSQLHTLESLIESEKTRSTSHDA